MIGGIKIDGVTEREEQIIRAVLMTYYTALMVPYTFNPGIAGDLPEDQVKLLVSGQVRDFADKMFPGLNITLELESPTD